MEMEKKHENCTPTVNTFQNPSLEAQFIGLTEQLCRLTEGLLIVKDKKSRFTSLINSF